MSAAEDIEVQCKWNCGQIAAMAKSALVLLPDSKEIWYGLALADRLGGSPEQSARMKLGQTIETVRQLLAGIKVANEILENDVDVALGEICTHMGLETPQKAERAKEAAEYAARHS